MTDEGPNEQAVGWMSKMCGGSGGGGKSDQGTDRVGGGRGVGHECLGAGCMMWKWKWDGCFPREQVTSRLRALGGVGEGETVQGGIDGY